MTLRRNQIILLGLIAHLVTAFFSIGYHQSDELFQIYEFAGYKLGINRVGDLPWEYASQMRSGIQPLMVYCVTKCFHALSIENPFTISCFVRLSMSLCSFWATVLLLFQLEENFKTQKRKDWLWALGLLFWSLPYFHARFSSENFSATLFVFGLSLILKNLSAPKENSYSMLAGFLFGLAFWCRFQMGFMLLGLFAWLLCVNKSKGRALLLIFSGLLLAFIPGLCADKWLYNQWTVSPWNYLDLNLFQDKASQFGRQPVYYYISEAVLQLIPPFSIFILCCIALFWFRFRTHVITWITLPFIALHFLIGHKELRFLFPVLNFLPFMILYSVQSLKEHSSKILDVLNRKWLLNVMVTINSLILIYFMFKPADETSFLLKKIYEVAQGTNPMLLYENRNPYNAEASLNYFRNPAIQTRELKADTVVLVETPDRYYFSEKFEKLDTVIINKKPFIKMYARFPSWFSYLNFNGWLERSGTFTIYKMENTLVGS